MSTWISSFNACGAAAWTTDTNMASCGISGHSGPSRGPVQKVSLSPSQDSVVAHSQGDAAAFGGGGHICISSRLLYTIPPTLLGNDDKASISASFSSVAAITSPVLPLSVTHAPLRFSVFPTEKRRHTFVPASNSQRSLCLLCLLSARIKLKVSTTMPGCAQLVF